MTKVVVSGACGKMGKAVTQEIKTQKNMEAIAGFDIASEEGDLIIYNDLSKIPETPDVIIDFSNPSVIKELTEYAVSKGVALAVGTTGLGEEHKRMLYNASKTVPVFVSHNMCLGVSLLLNLAKEAAGILKDYDIEIVEKHHNQKIDAPSGTALMIADAVKEVRKEVDYIYNRADIRKKRDKKEIGIHAIRGGNLVGEHTVLFIGEDETIQISHNLMSRRVLATGAVKVIRFIKEQKPGYYTMQDLINNLSI
jgi:4-hydroxy-tetrahydrodipicolinate reductase